MAGKIKIQVEDSGEVNEDPKLVEKVDLMMDPKKTEPTQIANETPKEPIINKSESNTGNESTPELDIFADIPGAPLLEKPSTKKTKDKAKKTASVKAIHQNPIIEQPITSEKEDFQSFEAPLEQSDRPDDYDDPKTTQAIDDIVAHESDMILALDDHRLSRAKEDAIPVKKTRHHRIFWSIIALLCLLAIATAVYIIYPSIYAPLGKVHWNSIRKHL